MLLLAMFPTIGLLLLNGLWNGPLYRASPGIFWIADVVTHVVIPAVMLIILMKYCRITPADYGLAAPHNGLGEMLGLVVFATGLYWISYKPVAAFFGHLLLSEPSPLTYVDVIPEQPLAKMAVALYFSSSAAVFEEIMYRGLPLLYATRVLPRTRVAVSYTFVSAILFGLAHWENGVHEVIGTATLGVVACAMYLKTRTLWPLIGAHFLIDMMSFG